MKSFVKRGLRVVFAGAVSLMAVAAAPTYAGDIHSFVTCLNGINSTRVSDAVACVPAGCYATVTLSEESAQPGCTLRDGTRLPRVIFSCPGAGGSQTLRFRPSFTLCTQGGAINHIEVGEDVNKRTGSDDPETRNFPYVQKMGDIDSLLGFQSLTEFGLADPTAVVDTRSPLNSKGCAECHDRKGTVTLTNGTIVNLFGPVAPAVAEGTIYTNDPAVDRPTNQTPLSVICTGIANSTQLARSPSKKALASDLCAALEPKTH